MHGDIEKGYCPLHEDIVALSIEPIVAFREYGRVHQHGGYLVFLEIAASLTISANAVMHQQY